MSSQLNDRLYPLDHIADRSRRRYRMELMLQVDPHWLRSGYLDQKAVTGEIRDRFSS